MSTLVRPQGLNGRLPDEVFFDERLDTAAIWLLEYMLRVPESWEIRRQDLYKRCPEGQYTVRRAIQKLEQAGYLEITQKHVNGSFQTSAWRIYLPGGKDVENSADNSRVLATNTRAEASQDGRVLGTDSRWPTRLGTASLEAKYLEDGDDVGGGGAALGSQRAAPPTEDREEEESAPATSPTADPVPDDAAATEENLSEAQLPIVGRGLSMDVEEGSATRTCDPDRVKSRRPEVAAAVESVRRGHREALERRRVGGARGPP